VSEVKQDPLRDDERDIINKMEENIKRQDDIIASLQQESNDYLADSDESDRDLDPIELQELNEIRQESDRAM
jgi:hypothetical protein